MLHENNGNTNDTVDNGDFEGFEIPSDVTVSLDEFFNEDINQDINNMNSYFLMQKEIYEKTLSPILIENENSKRHHKDIVLNNLFKLLKGQFIATYIFTFVMVLMIAISDILSISDTIIESMFSFMKFYISSILAELLAILFFIVKQVFDKSVFELFKNFDKDPKDTKNRR